MSLIDVIRFFCIETNFKLIMEETNNNFDIKRISELESKLFYVPDYQRGYKWTSEQVIYLLNDINEFEKNENADFYCLQPLAVKEDKENKRYEVIDGQQRLTTIHLILTIIDKPLYDISYQTRKASSKFLDKIVNELGNYSVTIGYNINDSINERWNKYTSRDREDFNNIDNYHFFGAYLTIKSWFDGQDKENINVFLKKLKYNTGFIWYEDLVEDNSKRTFRNLNSGKIPLTNAELLKAKLIGKIDSKSEEISRLEKIKFATEWDQIEQGLYDKEFWFFINKDNSKDRYQTRIDFIFELLVDIDNIKSNRLFTYHFFENNLDKLDWGKVKNLYSVLQEWFEDRKTYHLIGYIISQEFKKLKDLINDSSNMTKTNFLGYLREVIKDKIGRYDISEISYPDKKLISILLLHNIETLNKVDEKFARFSFANFNSTQWSLEHIHAQNSKDLEGDREANLWHEEMCSSDFINESLKKRIRTWYKINKEDILSMESTSSRKDIQVDINSVFGDENNEGKHSIENMALLSGKDNSALNNSPFAEKRKIIIEKEMEGSFIPIATKNVFSKYYSENVNSLLKWNKTDREAYKANIVNILKEYLPSHN